MASAHNSKRQKGAEAILYDRAVLCCLQYGAEADIHEALHLIDLMTQVQ